MVAFAFVDPRAAGRAHRDGDRHRRGARAGAGAHRAVPSEQSGRGIRMALRTLRLRLERLSVQQRQRVQSLGDSRHALATRQPADLASCRSSFGASCSCSAALALIVWRYLQDRTPQALLEAARSRRSPSSCWRRACTSAISSTGCSSRSSASRSRGATCGARSRSRSCSSRISIYSLQYLHVVTENVPGVNAQNLWGVWTAVVFARLRSARSSGSGYQYLGRDRARGRRGSRRRPSRRRASRGSP